jgi:hypothetical protein
LTTSERDAAWRQYAHQLGRLNVTGESLETAEIDFKAGFDAARTAIGQRHASTAPALRAHPVSNVREGDQIGPGA